MLRRRFAAFSDERRCDARDLELDADALDRIAHDPQVVERQVAGADENVVRVGGQRLSVEP